MEQRLIDSEKLKSDLQPMKEEWYGDVFLYAVEKTIDCAPTVLAIPIDRIKEAKEEVEGLCKLEFMTKPLKITVDRDAVLQIFDKLVKEVEG